MDVRRVIYLDAAASTPLAPEAFEATVAALKHVGSPGAVHVPGILTSRLIEEARSAVAELMRVGRRSVVFTASATEANNLALRGLEVAEERRGIVTTTIEHPSVLATAADLGAVGRPISYVGVHASGELDLAALEDAVTEETVLVSVQAANNETGVVQDIAAIAAIAHHRGALLHIDASQLMAWGPNPTVDECDLVTVSSHKMHGPQGAAALLVNANARDDLRAQVTGGGQERGLRSGTANVAAIAGFGAAARLALESGAEAAQRTHALRDELLAGLVAAIDDVVEHGAAARVRLPGILNLAIGVADEESAESEALLAQVPTVAASTGSACHAGAPGPSPVLLAMGIPEWEASRSIRLSLSRYSTAEDVAEAISALSHGYMNLSRLLGGAELEERYI